MLLELRRYTRPCQLDIPAESPGPGAWDRPLPTWTGPVLGLAFGTHDIEMATPATAALYEAYPELELVGCSTAGEVLGDAISDGSVVVALLQFATTPVRVVSRSVADDAGFAGAEAGAELASPTVQGQRLSAVLMFIDGLSADVDAALQGVRSAIDPNVAISGGVAGDGLEFERSWTLVDGVPRTAHLTLVGLYGNDVVVDHGVANGWRSFGPPRLVTRSDGPILYELDDEPVLDIYEHYLGDRTAELPSAALLLPLAVTLPDGSEVVRTILSIDDAARSMTFAATLPEGSVCSLMLGSTDRLLDGAAQAAMQIDTPASGPCLALAVSCVGRRMALGEETEDELDVVAHHFGDAAHVLGFYSYGEIAPTDEVNATVHNQSMTITAISERS